MSNSSTLNSIYLRRKNKVVIKLVDFAQSVLDKHCKEEKKDRVGVIASLNLNLESLGYTMSKALVKKLMVLKRNVVAEFGNELISNLKEMVGVKKYKPFYPNFPAQVMEASEAELYINAMLHYWSFVLVDWTGNSDNIWFPKYDVDARQPLEDKVQLKVVDLGNELEFDNLMSSLLSSNTSLSETDKSDLLWAVQHRENFLVPDKIPNKENLAFIAGNTTLNLAKYFNNATDVLRVAVAMSGGDVSLAEPCKFRNFKRSERKMLLSYLNGLKNITEDMLKWKERWIRLGEKLHPGEYSTYQNANGAFKTLRDSLPFVTFNSQIEKHLSEKDVVSAIDMLKERPGIMARKLDQLMRLGNGKGVANSFRKVADNVSTPVLLQVQSHFLNRVTGYKNRVFFPKGNVAKVQCIPNNLPVLPAAACQSVINACQDALSKKFEGLNSLGKCWVDPMLTDYLVPFSQRSASKSLRTLVRGSRIAFGDGKTIRFFIWWKEKDRRADLDLSAMMYDSDFQYIQNISYFNLRDKKFNGCHSGDVTSAPNGACEFIDLDIDSFTNYGCRYVVMCVNSFTGQPFKDLEECCAGWMLRTHPQSGEIFEPKTVLDKLDVTASTKFCVPMIVDMVDRKIIWADMSIKSGRGHNVMSDRDKIQVVGESLINVKKPNLYDLFRLHAVSRGQLVNKKEDAQTVFSVSEGITPFDYERIMSEFMVN